MNLSRKWLNEFVELDTPDREFAEAMTMSGSKVECYNEEADYISNVVVAKILKIEKHPDADKLQICQIDIGREEPIQIVTAAQNVYEGMMVPAALDNSTLAGGIKIKKGKLRGVPSNGMMCSVAELGVTVHDFPYAIEDGILILSDDPELAGNLTPGQDIKPIIGLDDHVVEFEITPNRPDCLSVIGLAREAAATYNAELRLHEPVVKGGADGNLFELLDVETPAEDLCPRYTARMVRNVKIGPSPKWMRERLRAMGVRPINNIVDITNYVMLEYGQPMHAFDYRYVQGGKIIVRRAAEGEELTTLDGVVRKLTADHLVIADETRAVGLAGIMGGENSEIVEDTVDVVFESANFNGTCIRKGALALGMRTEASAKFEKGLDILNTLPAVNRACELVEMLGAGEVVDGIIDILNYVPHPTTLKLRADKINELLGTDVSEEEMIRILRKLDFQVEGDDVTVPSWRGDVVHYSDLAEEVARFFGYNNIPSTLMRGQTTLGGYSDTQKLEQNLGSVCRTMGFDEIITYSFISPNYYNKINLPENSPKRDSYKILNPLGEDTSIMRTIALPSMLEILSRNNAYHNKSVNLYELAKIYLPRENDLPEEPKMLLLGSYGPNVNFFTLKGQLEAVFAGLRVEKTAYVADKTNPSYHPGRCAKVFVGGEEVGVIGQVHPAVAKNYGLDMEVYCCEVSFAKILNHLLPEVTYTPLPKYQSANRDLSILCDEAVTVAEVENVIEANAGKLLRNIKLFDIYRGTGVPEGKKSMAFSLELRADDRTLTDTDSEAVISKVLAALKDQLNATLR